MLRGGGGAERVVILCQEARVRTLRDIVVVFHLVNLLVLLVAVGLPESGAPKRRVNVQEPKVPSIVFALPRHEVVLVGTHVLALCLAEPTRVSQQEARHEGVLVCVDLLCLIHDVASQDSEGAWRGGAYDPSFFGVVVRMVVVYLC